jgi:hypothetical protein
MLLSLQDALPNEKKGMSAFLLFFIKRNTILTAVSAHTASFLQV